MKKQEKLSLRKIFVFVGICLIVCAITTFALWLWNIDSSQEKAQMYVKTLRELIPALQNAVPEERRDNTLSVLSVDGSDFAGIIEIPRYGSELPVGADWGKSSKYPCCFSGSIYNGTLQIGATTQKGQYDFYREISVGDAVYFTDMEGNRFILEISALRYEPHADQQALNREEAVMTLFIKNIYAFEYLIVYCNVAQ